MENPWLHRYAVLLAAGTLLLVVTGVFAAEPGHSAAGAGVGILAAGLAVWLSVAEKRAWLRWLGWIVLAAALVECALGSSAVLRSLPATANVAHAFFAQIFFAAIVAMAIFTSRVWTREPELVQDQGWPSLRSLAILTPTLVLAQIALGAAFRHKTMGLTPHIAGAMVVALLNLMAGIFVVQQFPNDRSLPVAAKTMMGITFTQVLVGVTVISLGSVFEEHQPPVIISIATHVAVGALTLASTLVLALLIRRNVRAKQA